MIKEISQFTSYADVVKYALLPLQTKKNLNESTLESVRNRYEIEVDNIGRLIETAADLGLLNLAQEIAIATVSLLKERYPEFDMAEVTQVCSDLAAAFDTGPQVYYPGMRAKNTLLQKRKIN